MKNHDRLIQVNSTYARGIRREAATIQTLRGLGWQVTESSREENTRQDIDAWRVLTLTDGRVAKLPISIKSLTARTFAKSGSLLFELDVLDSRTNTWNPSWFHNGKAKAYVVDVEGTGLYYISKAKLLEYIEKRGFDRTVQNTPDVVLSQFESRHSHIDAYSGIIRLSKLVSAGAAKQILLY